LLLKKLGKLVTRFSAEWFGKELGWDSGLQLGRDLRMEPDSLLGKDSEKDLSSLLAKWRKK